MLRRPASILALVAILSCADIPEAHGKPAPGVSGTLSLIPGLGQIANGDTAEGFAWFAVTVGGFIGSYRFGPWAQTAFLDLWMYNMYDAYRDAGAINATKYSVYQNYLAAFNPANLFDPIGAGVIGFGLGMASLKGRPSIAYGPNEKALVPVSTAFIALGEEGLFRGFLYPSFSNTFGSKGVGAVVSSVVFAAGHALYAGQQRYALLPAVFAYRTILGLVFCWQTTRNRYDMRKSIFAHSWLDVIADYDHKGVFGGGVLGGLPTKALGLKVGFDF